MDEATARHRLDRGRAMLDERRPSADKREKYVRGEQTLPFAPEGVTAEYKALQRQAVINYLVLWEKAPVQRMRIADLRTDMGQFDESQTVDKVLWRDVFQANQWDKRQSTIYRSMMRHGRGLASVWPNKANRARPIVRPESFLNVHIEMDPEDPATPLWAVKVFEKDVEEPGATTSLWLPNGARASSRRSVAVVYDATSFWRFERSSGGMFGVWELVKTDTNPLGQVPFALFDHNVDEYGTPWSALDAMIPQQDMLNTIRFDMLLAMQFSAYQQRVVTGFDPRVRDQNGNVQYLTDAEGTLILNEQGQPQPRLNTPGRVGVDRLLAFPGADTKVYSLPESNLKNYTEVYAETLLSFFATAQLSPSYLLSRMANLSGDALTGAEASFTSLLDELHLAAGEGAEKVAELAWIARGEDKPWNPAAEVSWAPAERRSFAQIVDGVTKLVANTGFPRRGAWEQIPGATQQEVDRWIELADDEAFQLGLTEIKRELVDTTVPREE